MEMNATVTRKSNTYSRSTDRIHQEQAAAMADARNLKFMTWLVALLFPLAIGIVLAAYFFHQPILPFLK